VTRFTLITYDDGRSILSTEEDLRPEDMVRVRRAFDEWQKEPVGRPLVISSCRVVSAREIELDLKQ
jgi:hypothetical protein